jgi:hypothetical protein
LSGSLRVEVFCGEMSGVRVASRVRTILVRAAHDLEHEEGRHLDRVGLCAREHVSRLLEHHRREIKALQQLQADLAATGLDASADSATRLARFKSPPSGMTPEERTRRRRWLEESAAASGKVYCCPELMGERERRLTPTPFAELLLAIARATRPASERGRFAA